MDSGQPIDIEVKVAGVVSNLIQAFPQKCGGDIPVPCGDTVCLECEGISIIVNSTRTQVFHPVIFTSFGIDLSRMKVLVIKSIFHFYAGFAPVAEEILLMGGSRPTEPGLHSSSL